MQNVPVQKVNTSQESNKSLIFDLTSAPPNDQRLKIIIFNV